ncbi:hypothetical protein L1049_001463 [Liquidambar formosana]|uniref:Uncharacterized protein n=1 Tax=Liquidambar formosana TaxID=63359 RepID=A0AAP0R5I8_LIQFO
MEFRPRDYSAEEEAYSLPRVRADNHPLSEQSSSHQQVDIEDHENNDFFDPLRGPDTNVAVTTDDLQDVESIFTVGLSRRAAIQLPAKEWTTFKRILMQRFSISKMISISSVSMSFLLYNDYQFAAYEKSSTSVHLEELDDPQKFAEEGVKVITQQEYVARLHELKDEINRAWRAEDRVTALKPSVLQVARLLMDTSVLQFYPMLFVLATDIMDMLGDMVWERIERKAEFAEDGTIICSLPENFEASDICDDAKETCYNWFCKIGSIRELLPRIYLELAILPCQRFLLDRPVDSLQRLVMMTRGLADPLASSYCRLYMARCAQKLLACDIGFLITCINDMKVLLTRIISAKEPILGGFSENRRLLVSLMEPTIEYIMKCIFKEAYQGQVGNVLVELGLGRSHSKLFGNFPCVSVILHHLLKELPTEVVSSNAVEILHLVECSNDYSFDQCLNYRLLGFRLCEKRSQMDIVSAVLDKVMKVVAHYDSLDEYLKVIDAYVDIILQNSMDNYLNAILEGILKRACSKEISETEMASLQSIFVKLLSHFKDLEDVFALNHFVEILDVMHGSTRSIVNMHILTMATRNGYIHDPTTIQLLFEISQALHDLIDYSNLKR